MSRSPYVSQAPSVSNIMLKVMLALLPAIAVYVWVYGSGILLVLLLASLTALVAEALVLRIRQRPVWPFVSDCSALLTAWLLALSLPPLAPWWLVVVGTFFAIVVAKQLYGGLGYNPFNPAMVGYAVLLISFPAIMTNWPAPLSLAETSLDWTTQWHIILSGQLPAGVLPDAVSMATPLDYIKTQLKLNHSVDSILQAGQFGWFAGKGAELVAFAYLLGGAYLLHQKIITWHLPISFILGLALMAAGFHWYQPELYAGAVLHLFAGATMLGAFFILTDPVSGPTTPNGKIIFALGVAVMTYLIRTFGGYPDGVAFSVLLMNMLVPLIDAWTQPRVFGHKP